MISSKSRSLDSGLISDLFTAQASDAEASKCKIQSYDCRPAGVAPQERPIPRHILEDASGQRFIPGIFKRTVQGINRGAFEYGTPKGYPNEFTRGETCR